MPHQSSIKTLSPTAQAQQMGNKDEQKSADLLMQKVTQSFIAQSVFNVTNTLINSAAMAFVSVIELAAQQVDLEAQLEQQKQSVVSNVRKFGIMTERTGKQKAEASEITETPTPTFS